jgi:mRNA (2'-O-methyladenosine-N6-)-methyltransferase
MSTHNDYRCKFCFQKPIIGTCFECTDCKNYTVCQNCYFNSSFIDDKHFNINSDHKFSIQIKTKNKLSKYAKW